MPKKQAKAEKGSILAKYKNRARKGGGSGLTNEAIIKLWESAMLEAQHQNLGIEDVRTSPSIWEKIKQIFLTKNRPN